MLPCQVKMARKLSSLVIRLGAGQYSEMKIHKIKQNKDTQKTGPSNTEITK